MNNFDSYLWFDIQHCISILPLFFVFGSDPVDGRRVFGCTILYIYIKSFQYMNNYSDRVVSSG